VARIKQELFSYLRAAQKQYATAKRRMSELKKESVELQKGKKTVNSKKGAQKTHGTEAEKMVGVDASTKAERKSTSDATKETVTQDQLKTSAESKHSREQNDNLGSESQQYAAGISDDPELFLRWREKKITSEAQSTQIAMVNAAADIASLETEVNNLFGLMRNAEDDSRQTSDEQDPLMAILSRMERQRAEGGRKLAPDHVDVTVPDFGEEFILSRYPNQHSESATSQPHQFENGRINSSGNIPANMSMMNLTSSAPYEEDSMPELATSFAILSLVAGQNATRMAALRARERELAVELKEAEMDRVDAVRDLSAIKDDVEVWLSLLEASSEVEAEMSSDRQAEARRVDAEVNVEKKQGAEILTTKVSAQRVEQDKALLQAEQDSASKAMLAKVASASGSSAEKEGAGGRLVVTSQHKAKQMAAVELMRKSVVLAKEKQGVANELSDNLQVLNIELQTERSIPLSSISSPEEQNRDQENMVAHWKKVAKAQSFTDRAKDHSVTEAISGEHEPESEQCEQLREHSQTTNSGAGSHAPAVVGGKQLTSSEHQALLVKCALVVSKNMRAAHHQYVAVAQHIAHLESQVGDLFALAPEQTG
jgi:hypothetical protein